MRMVLGLVLAQLCLVSQSLAVASADDKAAPRKVDFTVTAEALAKEILNDPKAGLAKYKDKVVAVTGRIAASDPIYSTTGIHLNGGKKKPTELLDSTVICRLPEELREQGWLLAQGQKVRVVGEVESATDSAVHLTNCTYTELESDRLQTFSARTLATAYAKSERAASLRYGDRYNRKEMFVEGVVKDLQNTKYGKRPVFDSTGSMQVVGNVNFQLVDKLHVGDNVRLKTMCRGYFKELNAVLVDIYMVLPKT